MKIEKRVDTWVDVEVSVSDQQVCGERARMTILQLPAQPERVETGAVQFGDDWPGVFIRGDNAFGYMLNLQVALEAADHYTAIPPLTRAGVEGLIHTLRAAIIGPAGNNPPAVGKEGGRG